MRRTWTWSFIMATVLLASAVSLLAFQEKPGGAPQGKSGSAPFDLLDAPIRPSLLKKYFPQRGSQNGMENYLAAIDRVSAAKPVLVYNWENYKISLASGAEYDAEERARILKMGFGDPAKVSVLEARKKAVQGLTDVRELVRAGNAKPVFSLHSEPDPAALFPELSAFKELTKFFVLDAYVAFADGNSSLATDTLILALTMANRLPQDSLISRLVTVAMNAIVLAEFERHLDQFSTGDIAKTMTCLLAMPEWEKGIQEALAGEERHLQTTFKSMRDQPAKGDLTGLVGEGSDELFKSMKPGDWSAFISASHDRASTRMSIARNILRNSEKIWFSELKDQGWNESSDDPPHPKSFVDAGEQFGDVLTDLIPNMAAAEAKYRTQLRLLRLHMRILDHKWRTGRLPERVELAAPPEEIQDHFGGGEFQYKPDVYGHYQLFSKGFRDVGRIDLRYRKDPNAVKNGDEPPPPNGIHPSPGSPSTSSG